MIAPVSKRLVVVSNRLPFVLTQRGPGDYTAVAGSGGLVSALTPVFNERGGTWIGWPGEVESDCDADSVLAEASGTAGYALATVKLNAEEREKFYHGFANEVIWPLFHDLPSFCNFDPAYWAAYIQVMRKFAQVTVDHSAQEDLVWVHDYHLMNLAGELRRLQHRGIIAFFLHIPFPPLDLFLKLPWRNALLRGLLEYDLVGFQTLRDRRNFVQCLRALIRDVSISGSGQVLQVHTGTRTVRIGHFPISIDYRSWAQAAAGSEVAERAARLHSLLPRRQLLLGVDRLDYTKGIPLRLKAYRTALKRYPDLHGNVTLIQVVVPSREDIRSYFNLRADIERLVSRINGEFTDPGGWVPIHYVFRSLEPIDLLAYYRAAEIALVTPMKDGMNLVAKEYCTCSVEEDCVLILSEFAGAAAQLRGGALLVNPYDTEGVADAIHRAYTMAIPDRKRRISRMRRSIQRRDVFWWVETFLKAAQCV